MFLWPISSSMTFSFKTRCRHLRAEPWPTYQSKYIPFSRTGQLLIEGLIEGKNKTDSQSTGTKEVWERKGSLGRQSHTRFDALFVPENRKKMKYLKVWFGMQKISMQLKAV
jgi:hypothetical protein